MGDRTKIEYLDATWSPIKGCSTWEDTHRTRGCINCWSERQAARFSKPGEIFYGLTKNGSWTGLVRLYPHELIKPVWWTRPRRIGVCFMGDMFNPLARLEDIAAVFGAMLMAPQHQYLLLTKNAPGVMNFINTLESTLPRAWFEEKAIDPDLLPAQICVEMARRKTAEPCFDYRKLKDTTFPPRNVWAGVSVENQRMARRRIQELMRVKAYRRWISVEPLLGPVNIDLAMFGEGKDRTSGMNAFGFSDGFGYEAFIDFVVVGGESGPDHRHMDLEWARSLRDQCKGADVPFFFKQTSGKGPIPDDLMVRQLPKQLEKLGEERSEKKCSQQKC